MVAEEMLLLKRTISVLNDELGLVDAGESVQSSGLNTGSGFVEVDVADIRTA